MVSSAVQSAGSDENCDHDEGGHVRYSFGLWALDVWVFRTRLLGPSSLHPVVSCRRRIRPRGPGILQASGRGEDAGLTNWIEGGTLA